MKAHPDFKFFATCCPAYGYNEEDYKMQVRLNALLKQMYKRR